MTTQRPALPSPPGTSTAHIARKMPMMRRYDVSYLDDTDQVQTTQHTAPANAVFEAAFSAFARGTLIRTTDGPCAVEDLWPGMQIETAEFGAQPLLWVGSMTILPNAPVENTALAQMTRITSDTFGMARPMPDLLVGPGARLLHRPQRLRELSGKGLAYSPARDFVDGDSVIQITPPRPAMVFHICLSRHASVIAQGVEMETYHPGRDMHRHMGPGMMALFMSLFPHLDHIADFGPLAHPHASREALHGLSAA